MVEQSKEADHSNLNKARQEHSNLTKHLKDAFVFVQEYINDATDFNKATLFEWSAHDQALKPLVKIGTNKLVYLGDFSPHAGFEYPRRAALSKTTQYGNIADGAWPDLLKEEAKKIGVNSIISVPIKLGGEVIGVINFFFQHELQGPQEHLEEIKSLCEVVGLSVSMNVRLFLSRERQARHIRSLAHEASNLIMAVEQASEVILQDPEISASSNLNSLVYHMISNLRDAVLLFKNLAAAERLNMGDFSIQLREHDIAKIVRTVINKRAPLFEMAYSVRIEPPDPQLSARGKVDKFLFERTLENILVNACKYSPKNGVIKVTYAIVGSNFEVSVSDQGPGIPPQFRQRVFEEFFTVPKEGEDTDEADSKYAGSGLGLYISNQVMQRHQGKIWIAPPADSGCTVHLQLPLNETLKEI
ncbi:MAG TPA: ATP-binding protein [Pyrinomonadaceae bacterium]|jgi:signal transduction histidine kinase|nr:ATP-binding protein [Pyrinomonadaceae bacterium]